MTNPRLATRYARSLIGLAQEQGKLESVLEDMKYLKELTAKSYEFTLMLRSPIIKADKKDKIFKAVLKQDINPLTNAFLELLVKKGREFFLPEMADAYISQYKKMNNIHDVTLTTAVKIDDELFRSLKDKITGSFKNGTVDLKLKEDPSLIGGFVLEAGDKLFDASIKRDLNDIKKQFLKNPYVAEM